MFAWPQRRMNPLLGEGAIAVGAPAVYSPQNAAIAAAFCGFVFLIAALAFFAPIGAKVLAVLLLAGPHNWIEFRYFLSRLPCRWPAQIRSFFLLSFAGLSSLGLGNIMLMWALNAAVIPWHTAHLLYGIWAVLSCCWSASLFCMAARISSGAGREYRKKLFMAAMVSVSLSVVAAMQPTLFGVALVYAHPLISLAILDRELERSKPQWQPGYRCALVLIPVVVSAYWLSLHGTQFFYPGAVAQHIVNQTGATLLLFSASAFWLSTLVFLDLLHYAVWLVAIPNWAAGWQRWKPTREPAIVTRFSAARLPVRIIIVVASLLVIGLWIGFSKDYVATSQIYFVVAIMHVLAEIPFLAWASR